MQFEPCLFSTLTPFNAKLCVNTDIDKSHLTESLTDSILWTESAEKNEHSKN
jgi:hypothetical protein